MPVRASLQPLKSKLGVGVRLLAAPKISGGAVLVLSVVILLAIGS